MAKSHRGVHPVFSTVLFILFGLIALVVTYRAVSLSTEKRTKAVGETVVKSWEFTTDGNTEGWTGRYTGELTVAGGYLRTTAVKTSHAGRIRNTSVATLMDKGNKFIKVFMAVSSQSARNPTGGNVEGVRGVSTERSTGVDPQEPELDASQLIKQLYSRCTPAPGCANREGICPLPEKIPVGGYCPPRNTRSFTFLVFYRLAGKVSFEKKPLALRGAVDSRFHEYTLRFPEVGPMTVDRLNIQFVRGVIPGDMIQVDWIRLASDRVVPTPKPSPGCYYQNVQCIQAPCDPILVCPTPTCRPRPPCLDAEPRCLLPETEDMCPTTTPKPSPGCYYQQVQCFKEPCPPILVCPTPQ